MKILYPEVFWLFIPVLFLLLPAIMNYRRGKLHLSILAGAWRSTESIQVFFIKTLAYWITLFLFFIFMILSLSGLIWGKTTTKDESTGFDLVIAVDISRSMLADDLAPSRISRGGEGISYILNSFESIRAALVIFKGKGEVMVPLTEDPIQMEAAIRSLSPDLYSVPGSDLEQGILSGLDAFPSGSPGKKALLLVTDGESLYGNPRNAAREAYIRGIPLFILGSGTSGGIVLRNSAGDVVIDGNGQPVVSRLNEEVLKDLADLTGGLYYNLSDPRSLGEITSAIRDMAVSQEVEGIVYKDQLQFRIFVLAALFFLVLNLLLGGLRWSRWF